MREAAGITRKDAGWEIRSSESKVSRMELGRVGFKQRDVEDLLTLYRLTDPDERDRLLDLAQQANNPGWWHRYGDILPDWFESYLDLEASADLIRTYELQYLPGLLQTADYARAVISLGYTTPPPPGQPDSAADIDRRVTLRIARQHILTRTTPRPARLWAVIDEATLRRPIGTPKTMRLQIETLIEASHQPNITLQLLPFTIGGHVATGGAFTILRFPDPDLPDIIYIEHLTSALYLDKLQDRDHYTATMDALSVTAPTPNQTRNHLTTILKDIDD